MIEIEMKFAAPNPGAVIDKLKEFGYAMSMTRKEDDIYFSSPHKDFAKSDEVLRIRSLEDRNELTYKGPKAGSVGKVREEIEVPFVANATPKLCQLLSRLGYTPKINVIKERSYYVNPKAIPRIIVTQDEVEGLGTYFELEVQLPELDESTLSAIKHLAQQIGLGAEERKSYLELILTKG